MTDSPSIVTASKWLTQSSSILVAAGAGLSASAISRKYNVGLDYTSSVAFDRLYPRMLQVSTMRCMYDAIGKHDWSPKLMWGYLFTHVNLARYNWGETDVYQDLKRIVRHIPDSFVVTTNADGMFEQNGFDMQRFLSTQGDYSLLQCLKPCSSQAVFDAREYMDRALPYVDPKTFEVPSKFIPKCPRCGSDMFYCVRGGDWFLESAFDDQRRRYRDFLNRSVNKGRGGLLTIVEIGVGFNTPSVLRWPMEELVTNHDNVRLIRINMHAPDVPTNVRNRAVAFGGDAASIIQRLSEIVSNSS
ncbi:unnamed protein product [Didymodactylos carnosus]|uniref:Deacetylase sirtuin-type domain-containing protein n=1 Tax=Didymodactylos carnosus TaxID=1234261 RepID=A0A814W156_9BILA|nr:unnamed protein product [Didymodactylos carnosus]CAF1221085.1 unnamed protein product [Didymodactylos carnosus]CAF3960388.1 unnamed protein product [Didymodactylos carnosus]CAF4029147.1 unnamed protein product [Didymodactylos carnosus]